MKQETGGFTGRHMLIVMLMFFGTIISVNLFMAFVASNSWSGLVVKSSYVAGQQFNRRAEEGRAQAALGWNGTLTIAGGSIRYNLTDDGKSMVKAATVNMNFRRPASEGEDWSATLERTDQGDFAIARTPKDGLWIIEIIADVGNDRPYRDVRRVVVNNGTIR